MVGQSDRSLDLDRNFLNPIPHSHAPVFSPRRTRPLFAKARCVAELLTSINLLWFQCTNHRRRALGKAASVVASHQEASWSCTSIFFPSAVLACIPTTEQLLCFLLTEQVECRCGCTHSTSSPKRTFLARTEPSIVLQHMHAGVRSTLDLEFRFGLQGSTFSLTCITPKYTHPSVVGDQRECVAIWAGLRSTPGLALFLFFETHIARFSHGRAEKRF